MRIASAPARSPRRMRRRARWSAATARRADAPALHAPELGGRRVELSELLEDRADVEAHAGEEGVGSGGVVLLSARAPGTARLLARGWSGTTVPASANRPREARIRPRSNRAAQRATSSPARDGARLASPPRAAPRGRGRAAPSRSRSGAEAGGRKGRATPGRGSRARARSRPRRRAAPRGGSPREATPRRPRHRTGRAPRRGARGGDASRAVARAAAPRRAAPERGGVEARLERVERDPERAPRHGAALPLEERKEQLERAERRRRPRTGACRRRGGPARREGRRRKRGARRVRWPRHGVPSRRERAPRGSRSGRPAYRSADSASGRRAAPGPPSIFRRARRPRARAPSRHRPRRASRRRGGERAGRERRGAERRKAAQPGGHAKARPPRRWRCR